MGRKKLKSTITTGTERSVIKDYFECVLTLKEIAAKHYISVRSVYNIISRHGYRCDGAHPRKINKDKHGEDDDTVSLRLKRSEIELIFLMYLETEPVLTDSDKITADLLTDKLLQKIEALDNKYA